MGKGFNIDPEDAVLEQLEMMEGTLINLLENQMAFLSELRNEVAIVRRHLQAIANGIEEVFDAHR